MEIMTKAELEARLSAFEERVLNEIKKINKNSNETDEQLNKTQVAGLLGCSKGTAKKFFNHPTFPKPKITGKYSKLEIKKWMEKDWRR